MAIPYYTPHLFALRNVSYIMVEELLNLATPCFFLKKHSHVPMQKSFNANSNMQFVDKGVLKLSTKVTEILLKKLNASEKFEILIGSFVTVIYVAFFLHHCQK